MTKQLAKKIGFGSIKNLWTQAEEAYNWKEYERSEIIKSQERQAQNLRIKNWARRMKKHTGGGKITNGWKKEASPHAMSSKAWRASGFVELTTFPSNHSRTIANFLTGLTGWTGFF